MGHVRPQPFSPGPQRTPRSGFSFVEVMFAVVILGIGFIMVAAIFPVAISQNQVTGEQASSSAFARVSASVMQQLCTYNASVAGYNFSPSQVNSTGVVNPTYVFPVDSNAASSAAAPVAFPHGGYYAAAGGLISSADPRFAVVPLYSLSATATVAQFYFFNVTVRNQPIYTANNDVAPYNTITSGTTSQVQATLTPKLLKAVITAGTPSLIAFENGTISTDSPLKQANWAGPSAAAQCNYTPNAVEAVGTGCYVVVGSDNGSAVTSAGVAVPNTTGLFNGKVYKIGNQRLDLNAAGTVYELAPGGDFSPLTLAGGTVGRLGTTGSPTFTAWADVWIVGKGLQNHSAAYTAGSNTYTDAVQDVSFYSTFAPLQ